MVCWTKQHLEQHRALDSPACAVLCSIHQAFDFLPDTLIYTHCGVCFSHLYYRFGLVHACHELYGARVAGLLLTALGRLLVAFLQISGHTCGIEDLTLTRDADEARCRLISEVCAYMYVW